MFPYNIMERSGSTNVADPLARGYHWLATYKTRNEEMGNGKREHEKIEK